jgi:hypothetical protein
MTRDDIAAWALEHIRGTSDEEAAFYLGVYHAVQGTFAEEHCGPAGWIGESLYCAGGREGALRLEQASGARGSGRIGHGRIVRERS